MRGLTRQLGLRDATLLVESVLGSNTNSSMLRDPSDVSLYGTICVLMVALQNGGSRASGRAVVTTADAALSKTASLDEMSGYHASDHRPVAGTVVFRVQHLG